MQIQENISLKPYNTFGINATAKHFAPFADVDQLNQLLDLKGTGSPLILGGGSNMLLTRDLDTLVLKNEITGITITGEDENHFYVTAGGGENWHKFVLHCIDHGYAGAENLSLIPGSVGASPMQNIGAYGMELKDIFYQLEAFHIADRQLVHFKLNDCRFGYRDSVFKGKYKNQFVITSVTFRLLKTPKFNITYGAIQQELNAMNINDLSIRAVSQAVINIRRSKLPDPNVIGNAGSFFKNPSVPTEQFEVLKRNFPGIVGFSNGSNYVKLAAGWLIEQCGWKGYRKDDAGCYDKQALVLVNYGGASGTDILALSTEIMHSVEKKFGVLLEREVNII
ncbi:UDP-N-acetylmuramate dehydrogenase [Segetibacter sp. 3557_3]|uniref:UDP-N-acetylmuramate dehydrogenase n=1 Tax=Segetibacter sp. 3557_3 TaxID=2547429 RepID=UPI00105853B3|nr:UDP-N-acetylmuramate dehydrogenase [Segetibacter sp. 3557_3]TDH29100.1 UDP-N-acetylmuramate dehydrogenase [Segetibacter sp. 3557_3]